MEVDALRKSQNGEIKIQTPDKTILPLMKPNLPVMFALFRRNLQILAFHSSSSISFLVFISQTSEASSHLPHDSVINSQLDVSIFFHEPDFATQKVTQIITINVARFATF